ncbi:MAG: ParB/RepB/Spo0J family partition protein [Candidatus Omnitrophota bacterium]
MNETTIQNPASQAKFLHIPIHKITPTPDNPRRSRPNDPRLRELTDSIRALGVLEPILVRPLPAKGDGEYELRSGERRWRAAREAGLTEIPALAREMDDLQALAITVTENLQREDLHPLEEAQGIQSLLDHGWTLEQTAAQIGKSPRFTARRAQLNRLTPIWRELAFDENGSVSAWSAAHLELIARLPAAMQEQAAYEFDDRQDAWKRYTSLNDLRRHLADQLRALSLAPWKLEDESLFPEAGACSACVQRSDHQPLLFDEEEFQAEAKPGKRSSKKPGANVHCLNAVCWKRKAQAFIARREEELRQGYGKSLILVGDRQNGDDGDAFVDQKTPSWKINKCRKSAPGARPCLSVDGPDAGKFFWGTNTVHGDGNPPREPGQPSTLEERQAKHRKQRQRIVVQKVIEQLEKWQEEDSDLPAFIGACERLALVLTFGTAERLDNACYDHHYDADGCFRSDENSCRIWDELEKRKQLPLAALTDSLLRSACAVLFQRLKRGLKNDSEPPIAEAKRACAFFGLDFAQFERMAEKKKPDPKSWEKEAEKTQSEQAPEDEQPEQAAETLDMEAPPAKAQLAAEDKPPECLKCIEQRADYCTQEDGGCCRSCPDPCNGRQSCQLEMRSEETQAPARRGRPKKGKTTDEVI